MVRRKAIFNPPSRKNIFIVYELDTWSRDLNFHFTLKDCLFGSIKLAKNADPDKYSYSGNGFGFGSISHFSLPKFDWGKNVITFRVDMSSSVHIDNNKKGILTLFEDPTQRLEDTTLPVEAKYSITFSRLH